MEFIGYLITFILAGGLLTGAVLVGHWLARQGRD